MQLNNVLRASVDTRYGTVTLVGLGLRVVAVASVAGVVALFNRRIARG